MPASLTTVIIARNAETTIERAVQSVRAAGTQWPILLVDDWSDDQTAAIAKDCCGDQVTVVKPESHIGTGAARHAALDHINTPYAVWLDADDAVQPQRQEAVLKALLDHKADMVVHEVTLKDGASGQALKHLPIPDFLDGDGLLWQLERNWLPFLGPGFRVGAARRVGYNQALTACEDYDYFLRALLAGQSIHLLRQDLLDHYAYAGSVSRQRQNHQVQLHTIYSQVLAPAKYPVMPDWMHGWIRLSNALYAEHVSKAQEWIDQLYKGEDRLLPPYQRSLTSCVSYVQATVYIRSGNYAAAQKSLIVNGQWPTEADSLNALAVALWGAGDEAQARQAVAAALAVRPDYGDAQQTRAAIEAKVFSHAALTSHPLRYYETRSDY